jgi:DNA-binding MarR family transcriptional regulator
MHMSLANRTGAFALLLNDALETALDGLSPSAAAFLLTAHYKPGSTTTQIAAIAGVSQPTGVRVLAGLRERGLVQEASRQGRESPIHLTREGDARAAEVQAARLSAMETLVDALSPREQAQLQRLMDKMLAAATTSRAFARTTCRLCDHGQCDLPECPLGARACEIEQDT